MLCQDCRHYCDSKRPEDTAEEYSCPSCMGVAGQAREFPKDTYTENEARKRKYYETWPVMYFDKRVTHSVQISSPRVFSKSCLIHCFPLPLRHEQIQTLY